MSDELHLDTRSRMELVLVEPKRPDSLVGSYFHSEATPGWQGVVVGEPQPGIYLVQLFSWIMGEATSQHLVPIDKMMNWMFYDSADEMNDAYERSVSDRWERERRETA